MRHATLFGLGVVITLMLVSGPAWPVPTVYFEPAEVQVERGQLFSVGIRIDAGADTLTCFLVEFSFDEETIELVSAAEGTLMAECGFPTMFDWDRMAPGMHSCNDVTLGYDSFALCPGELVRVDFVALAEGSTTLDFSAVDLRDIRRERILPVATGGGSVTVVQGTGLMEEELRQVPNLHCFPNPFRNNTTISLRDVASPSDPMVSIFDVGGRLVASPRVAASRAGVVEWLWNGRGTGGRELPDGVYFVRVDAGDSRLTRRVTLMK